jgi:hypothetical protein
MIKTIIAASMAVFTILPAAMFCACTQGNSPEGDDPPGTEETRKYPVEFTFRVPEPPAADSGTGAENKTEPWEVHFYLFGPESVYRRVTAYSTLPLELALPAGRYSIYAVANSSGPGREMTERELHELVFERSELGSGLVMSCRDEIFVSKDALSKEVVLTCAAAKVVYNIKTPPGLRPARIEAVQLCNLPDRGYVLDDGLQLPGNTSGDGATVPVGTSTAYGGSFYMPENHGGKVSSITSPAGRTPGNAPAKASFIRIRTNYRGSIVEYRLYPGGNQADDFNVLRGMCYTYDITLRGRSTSDMQVTMTAVPL